MSNDWLDRSRQKQVDRCLTWIDFFSKKAPDRDGRLVENWVRLNVLKDHFLELVAQHARADEMLSICKDRSRHTSVVTKEGNKVFAAFEAFMRVFKKFYIHCPPLTPAEMVLLGFHYLEGRPMFIDDPSAIITVIVQLGRDYGEVIVQLMALDGDLNARENKGPIFLAWKTLPPGSPAPESWREVNEDHISTHRKKITISLGREKSGWDIYFVARIEDGERRGKYGPVIKARLP